MSKTLVIALLALAVQANAAVVSIVPASKTVNVGDTFNIGVEGSAFVDNLDGGGLNLSFNPAVLEVLDVVIDGTAWDFLPAKGVIDNLAGTVSASTFNQFSHPKVGSFSIFEYQFKAIGAGTSPLLLSEFSGNPFASGGETVATSFVGGTVTAAAVPEPSTALTLAAGLIGVLGLTRRARRQR
jgi:PEP-CTERM motif